jgi:hypothetical protein
MHGAMSCRLFAAAAAVSLAAGLSACNLNPSAPPLPPARASIPAGQVYAPFSRYLAAHPQPHRRGMAYGILVQSRNGGYVCLNGYCRTWSATVVVTGGRIEHLSSDEGDDGMAALVQPGDLFAFPAGGTVDAPADDGGTLPVQVIIAGAVKP